MTKQIYKTRIKQGLTIDKDLFNTMDINYIIREFYEKV